MSRVGEQETAAEAAETVEAARAWETPGEATPGTAPRTRRARALALVAGVLAVLGLFVLLRSMLAMTYLNVQHAGEIDPFSRAVSHYAFVEHAVETFNATLIAVAVATVAILVGMTQLGVRLGVAAVVLLVVWCVALVLCVLFPTDDAPRVQTASGWIHQFAGAALFITLPISGFLLSRQLAGQPDWTRTAHVIRRLAVGATTLALGYLAARLPDLLFWWSFPAALDWRSISGLVQRGLFVLELAMLLMLAVQLLRVAWRRRPSRGECTRGTLGCIERDECSPRA